MTDKQYWVERWQQQQTGFHRSDVHPALARWYSEVITEDKPVFVPLCGKSLDMIWLISKGHHVVGVEISEIAVLSFLQENSLNAMVNNCRQFQLWETGNVSLYCGDFFDLQASDLSSTGYVYDRAALVALDSQSRLDYANHLIGILPDHASILLLTVEYDQNEMAGPPFSVSNTEVSKLYEAHYDIRLLSESDVTEAHGHLVEKGLTGLIERVYHLKPRVNKV